MTQITEGEKETSIAVLIVFAAGLIIGGLIGAANGGTEIDMYSGAKLGENLGEEIAIGLMAAACINQRGNWNAGFDRCEFRER